MNHITDMLDNTPFEELTESDLSTIRAHAANCAECADAFAAARISSLLLQSEWVKLAEKRRKCESVLSNARTGRVA